MLEKSNSCGSLPLQKAMGTQKQEAKAMLGLKKYTTDEGKPILKKKGRAAAVVKNRAKWYKTIIIIAFHEQFPNLIAFSFYWLVFSAFGVE